jgi:Protein of unknown function (DUF2380)
MRTASSRCAAYALLLICTSVLALGGPALATEPQSVAFLGVRFINDNADLEPTTEAERNRLAAVAEQLETRLAASGQYAVVDVPPEVEERIARGQHIGECGGCEIEIGKELGADRIAWMTVQKVSNLILNLNVYMADVETAQMTFLRSVDIRGNTDRTWSRSLDYLLKNYLLKDEAS